MHRLVSLLLTYALLLQLVPRVAIAARFEPPKSSPSTSGALRSEKTNSALGSLFNRATGIIESLFASEPANSAPTAVPTPTPANGIGIVRHAPSLNGNGRVEGSLRQLTGESVTLNGGAVITNDLQVPGTPTLLLNGSPTFGGTIQGTGIAQPTNYQVTLNGTSSTVLGHLVTRTNPITLTNVTAPPASSGTRSVTITAAGQSAGNFATLRDLTLNGNVGMYSVPAGTYRNFIANAGSGFILGVSGATQAAVYNMNSLTLNGSAQFQVIGPVILTLGNGLTVNASMGVSSNPAWLKLQIAAGGLTLNSGSLLNAVVNAPASTVIINATSNLVGTLICDRLTINGGGLLRLIESAVNQAPTVNAGGNQTINLPSVASLNGSASDDGLPMGSTLTTTWTKVSGPGTVTFANPNSAVTTATFSQAGTYVVRLTASDSQLSNFSNATVTVVPQNFPPSVSAGPDRIVTQPNSATLNGSASDDGLPAGSSLSLLWTKVSGPGTVTFTSPTAAITNASFSVPGSYTLRLTASDSQLSNFDDAYVTVNPQNQAPNVAAGADQNITLPSSAILHGTVTDDGLPTGSSVTITWSKLSGPGTVTFTSPNNVNTNASFSVAGNYTLQLTASDTALSNHDEVDVHVAAQNHAPTVSAGTNQAITLPASGNLNGSVSDDALPAGSTLTTVWSKVSGPGTVTFANPNAMVTTADFSDAGNYVLRLTASDSELSSSDEMQITVIPENHAPTANAGADQTITLPNTASLNGSVSDDDLPGGSSLTTLWSKVSGSGTVMFGNPNALITTAAFSEAGTYVLRLTASDSDLSHSHDATVTVIPENHAPNANAGADQTITLPANANLNGSVSDDGLPAGNSVTSTWSEVSGPGTVTFANPNVTVTTAAFSEAGSYVLRLTASDSELSNADEITITVKAENHAPTANAGADQTITLPATASLNGTVSDDGLPAGNSVTSTWSKVSGPGTVNFGNLNLTITTAAFSEAGNYILRLTASDSELTSSDDIVVTVIPENHAPTANAGADRTITLPATASLNGTVSDDGLPAGSALTTTWTMVSGPGSVTFANASVTVTTAAFSVAGAYVLRLTGSDSELSTSDEVEVIVIPENHAPTSNAGTDQTITLPNTASLNGTASDDGLPAGSTLTTTWSKVNGPGTVMFASPNATVTSATFSAAGTYVLRFTVSDSELSHSDDLQIAVIAENLAPAVNAGADQVVTFPAGANLNGSVSDDGLPAGSSLTTTWSQVSGPATVTFANPAVTVTTVSFSQPGNYLLRLTASDSELTTFDDITIVVTGIPPVSNFIVPESTGSTGSFVIASSGAPSSGFSPDKILDDTTATYWTTPAFANQFAKMQFFDQQMVYIDRVRLQAGNFVTPATVLKDFDVQISATTSDDANFVTVLSGTMLNNGQLQEFVFTGGPVRARYIKLLLKTNYGSSSQFTLGTFNPVAVGSADRLLSLAGQSNVAFSQSPALPSNGGAIYNSSYPGGLSSANNLIGYFAGGWQTSNTPNQFATIQLAGGKSYTIEGVKIATWYDFGNGFNTSVKDFEVWVSNTTPDALSFTKVLTATAPFVPYPSQFLFPGGPVQARYVKYVPLNNNGGGTTINTQMFDVIVPGTARVVGVSEESPQYQSSAQAAFDGVTTTNWIVSGNVINVWVKTALANNATRKIYGVRIHPMSDSSFQQGPKDFDIRVSTTTTDNGAFSTVYSGTVSTLNVSQEFLFPNLVDARYVQFFWKNAYHSSVLGVKELEVLSAPDQGSGIISFSAGAGNVGIALDLDASNQPWVTPLNQNTNVSFNLLLPRGELTTISHIALRPAIAFNGNYRAPKDFEFQVSTTDAADSSFITVFAGALVNSIQLQDFYFAPVQARYVRLVLIKPPGDFSSYGLHNFMVYSSETIGTTTRFVDRSTDSDGQVVSWAWDFGDGTTSALKSPTHTFAQPGDYTVSLTVTDNSGLTNSYSCLYHVVESVNADFVLSPIVAHEGGETVRFLDTQRLLSHLDALRRYDFGEGSAPLSRYEQSSIYTYPDSGVFHVTLKVGDPFGAYHIATRDITVLNMPPAVAIDPGKTLVWGQPWTSVPQITDQSPVDRLSLQGQWDFGDGQTSTCVNCTNANATVTHAYDLPGIYTAVLTISDKDGGVGSDSAVFTINKRPTAITFLTTESQGTGETYLVRAKLTDTFGNLPLPNKPLQFVLNGVATNAITNASGIAEVNFNFAPGALVGHGTATFVQDGMYLGTGSAFRDPLPPTNPPAGVSNKGKDFWIVTLQNLTIAFGSIDGDLYLTSEVATTGTLTPAGVAPINFSIPANGVKKLPDGFQNYVFTPDAIENKGIHVTSQDPISVVYMSNFSFTSDAYLALPTEALGTDYIIQGYANGSNIQGTQFGLVAPSNGTSVTITPTITTGNRLAGVPFTITLNQGQTYYLRNETPGKQFDFSGTQITSNKPIAVFGGHKSGSIPDGVAFASHLIEHLPPTNTWGKHFVTMPYKGRNGDTFRFMAAEDATNVYLNGQRIALLNRAQIHERIVNGPAYIVSDKPILVVQYSNGFRFDLLMGDPSMAIVPPYEQYLSSYVVANPDFGVVQFINVIAAASAVGNVILDGAAIPASSFVPISNSGFSGAQISVARGVHKLTGPSAFGVSLYGFGQDDAYSFPGGMNLRSTVSTGGLVLTPNISTASIGTQKCVTASLADQFGMPLGGQAISFSVTGANPSSSSGQTNAAGQAQLCYIGANTGTDSVTATRGNTQAAATIIWTPPNQAPAVNAGMDQSITMPVPANLSGSATDDGLPLNTLTYSWTKVSGPGNVVFGNATSAASTAIFNTSGVYVLRLTASDTGLSGSDEVQITVNPVPPNQAPTANAGPDQSVTINGNLIFNGGNEEQLINGEIAGWTEVQGNSWIQGSANTASGFPEPQRGTAYFFANDAPQAELRQDVDVSAFAASIAAGTQQFEFKAWLRSFAEALPDAGRVIVEYRDVTNTNMIASLDSGDITSTGGWQLTEDTRVAPVGTGWIRVRLIAARNPNAATDARNDAFFDSISLRPIGVAAVKLSATVSDDGLPYGSSLTATWNQVSGPGTATFAVPNAAVSGVSFSTPGTYVLRLTSSDGDANTSDDVTVIVNPANQAPAVNAGSNQTITLPATADLNGTVTDDGQPLGSSLSVSWSKLSGPGMVTFAHANQTVASASFSADGTYVLRLTADDTEYSTAADVTITVNSAPVPVNQPPAVNPGPSQTISLPTDTVTLNGNATDDGLPVGSTLVVTWTQISGPGVVTFGNANSAVTTAQFSAVGSYVLRLSASDGGYLVSADVGVILTPQNQSPTANAGADQITLLSQGAQLNGSASDDGLPAGSNLTTNWTKVSGPGTVTFMNPNVTITGAQFSAIGTYVLRLTASDGALTASDEVTVIVNDNVAPPTVEITAPTDGSNVTEPASVNGSVSGDAWQLQYSLASDDNPNNRVWTTFASGNGATSGTLGTLDPTMMLNGLFDIRLSATDSYGQTSWTKVSVFIEGNLKVGNFTLSFTDLSIPVAGLPMEVARSYDSRDKRVGDFGFGWTMGLRNIRVEKSGVIGLKWYETASQEVFPNYCLQPLGSNVVSVTFPGGKVFKFKTTTTPQCQRFTPITGGTVAFTPLPGTHGTLQVVGSADFQIDGSVPGPVNLVGFGGGVDIFNSFVFKFTAEDGTSFIIDQRTGLKSLTDTSGNTVTINPGGIVHSNGKSIVFHRDSAGRIESIDDPNGNSMFYHYDPNGDLDSFTDNESNTSTYTYDSNHRLLTINDPRNIQPIRNDYDPDTGRLISHTDAFGKHITYLHDIPNRTETVTDRFDHPTVFEYDERGNVLKKTDARGGVTEFTYDANDNVLTEKNALNKTTIYTYDANDNRTSITDPLNNVTRFTYNPLGKVLTIEDPLHRVTTNTYDSAGRLKTTEDPLHNITSYNYSVLDGQLTSMTDALHHPTTYAYTGGYVTKETDALGNETTFTYDNNSNRKSQTVKRTNALGQLETITTNYEYDKLNRLTKTIFPDASFTKVEYNSIGQQETTIDQLDHRTEFTYDDMGRLTKTKYADGTFEETTYDAEGRRKTSKDRAEHLTSYDYDELGRLRKTTFSDGKFTQTSYDAAGQVETTTDARNNVTHYFYDDAGRRKRVKNALNQETLFTYDDNGNQRTMTDALNHTTTYDYDHNNRRKKTTYHDGSFDSVVYDELGRTLSKTDQAIKTTGFTYDELGRLLKVKDALNQETIYGYNELGQQVSQTDANNHTTRFEYDQLGRRVKRILPAGQFETYSYDNGGNPQSRTDFNGKTTTFNYDVMRRLLSKVPDVSLNQPTVSFTYNTSGQRATMNDASGTTIYGYDVRNRLSSKQTPFGTLSYTYNEAGSLLTTRSSNTNGVSVDYDYDALNRLASVKDNNLLGLNGGVTNYTYDNVGNLESYSYPNGVTSSYAYNSLNRLTTMTVGTQVSSLAGYTYTLGATGNRTAVTELSGRTVNYTYDDLYRLTNEAIANDPHGVNGTVSYGYDPVGNRLNRTSSLAPVPSQSSTYDANDRLTSDNYDNNGNTTSANSNTYAYDFENHLTSLNGGSAGYAYDGDGNRVAKTVAGVTTNYLVDTNNPTGYPQVVDELQGGTVVKSFTYGHDLISQRIVGGSLNFYQYDGHGSVRLLTDATAAVTDTYDYDAFGNLIYRSGATPNDYLYTGEQFDADLGFYYLRARYLNPQQGRFFSMDTFEGNSFEPLSLHKYLYAGDDPVNMIDPSGNSSQAELNVVMLGYAVISTMAIMAMARILEKVKINLEINITFLPPLPQPEPDPEPEPGSPPFIPPLPTPSPGDPCDCYNNQGISPVLLEGSIDGPPITHWGRLHIAKDHGFGMNPNKSQFRLGLAARTPLQQLLDEGILWARQNGKKWVTSTSDTGDGTPYCKLNTKSENDVGIAYGKSTKKFRIIADIGSPYRVISMYPR